MFGIHIITDVIKVPACDLQYVNSTTGSQAVTTMTTKTTQTIPTKVPVVKTKKSLLPIIHREIDILYPNRVLIDIGLVISRYYGRTSTERMYPAGDNAIGSSMATKKRKRPPTSSSSTLWKVPKKHELLSMGTKLLQNGGTCDSYGTSNTSSNGGGCGVHYKVQFPVIVFRPYVGEVLYGTICDMNPNGIIVTLGNFFAAIYVPTIYMLHPSTYVHTTTAGTTTTPTTGDRGIWVWTPTYDDDDDNNNNNNANDEDNDEPLRYEMNIGDEIRVRVKSIHYSKPESTTTSSKNGKPSISSSNNMESGNNNTSITNTMNQPNKRPRSSSVTMNHTSEPPPPPTTLPHCAMYIIASICEDGLGLTSWWKNEDEEEDDENDDNDDEE